MTVDDVCARICGRRFPYTNEKELQAALADCLSAPREVRAGANRYDLMIDGIVIEVKVGGSSADLLRQVHRYAGDEAVKGIVAVVTSPRLVLLPDSISGKPVRSVMVGRWM